MSIMLRIVRQCKAEFVRDELKVGTPKGNAKLISGFISDKGGL